MVAHACDAMANSKPMICCIHFLLTLHVGSEANHARMHPGMDVCQGRGGNAPAPGRKECSRRPLTSNTAKNRPHDWDLSERQSSQAADGRPATWDPGPEASSCTERTKRFAFLLTMRSAALESGKSSSTVTASRMIPPTDVALRFSSSCRKSLKFDHIRCLLPPNRSTHLRRGAHTCFCGPRRTKDDCRLSCPKWVWERTGLRAGTRSWRRARHPGAPASSPPLAGHSRSQSPRRGHHQLRQQGGVSCRGVPVSLCSVSGRAGLKRTHCILASRRSPCLPTSPSLLVCQLLG